MLHRGEIAHFIYVALSKCIVYTQLDTNNKDIACQGLKKKKKGNKYFLMILYQGMKNCSEETC